MKTDDNIYSIDSDSFYDKGRPRKIGFLVSDEKEMNAFRVYKKLEDKQKDRDMLARFDAWVDGISNKPKWFHGWNATEYAGKYTHCFVFKCLKTYDRFYGFLCNPIKSHPSHQVCILVCHTKKNEFNTDERNLKIAESARTNESVNKAINNFFEEYV